VDIVRRPSGAWARTLCACAVGCALALLVLWVGQAQEAPAAATPPLLDAAQLRQSVPEPVLGNNREWVALYWAAWDIASTNVRKGNEQNGLVDLYLGNPAGPHLSQWDACLSMMYARYGYGAFPGIASLDNFYRKQHQDGFICREISGEAGQDTLPPADPGATGPPLFSWAELEHYRLTGDKARLVRILPMLDRYFQWLKANRRRPNGLYWTSSAGSEMDGSPRGDKAYSWVDLSAQQALNARCVAEIARVVGDLQLSGQYDAEFAALGKLINQLCWDAQDGFYYDLDQQGQFVRIKTVAGFWPLVAGVADKPKAAALVAHLGNPQEFGQRHVFPSLSADQPGYDPAGGYWRGSVFPSANYAIIKGLQAAGEEDLAAQAAANDLTDMAEVYKQTRDIYESYAPALAAPGTQAQGHFVGSSGCGPIALLLENVIGLRAEAATNTVFWRLRRTDRHGVRDLRFGSNTVSLICDSRMLPEDTCNIAVRATQPFTLEIETSWAKFARRMPAGQQPVEIRGKRFPRPKPAVPGE